MPTYWHSRNLRRNGTIDELIALYELAGSSPPSLKRTPEFEAEHEAEIARFRSSVLAEKAKAEEDICGAGSPAFGGYCGDADCVCGGVPLSLRSRVGAV